MLPMCFALLFGVLALIYRGQISLIAAFLGETAIELAKSYNSVYLEENESKNE
jgi:hypothetical protein